MEQPKPPASPEAAPATPASSPAGASTYKAPQRNPALRMLGLPGLPKKLPSRNWMIFLTLSTALSSAIIYDKREKKRATAKWRRAVSHLATQPLPNSQQMPRKITVYLESPPGDGPSMAREHFHEYIKPVLAESGMDWDFVLGRMQGDVRAAVAEKIRQARRTTERPGEDGPLTTEQQVAQFRKERGIPEYQGIRGDLVVGRHTWKEYVRGIHEGWLGSLDPPPSAEPVKDPDTETQSSGGKKESREKEGEEKEGGEKEAGEKEGGEKKEAEPEKKSRPAQPPPHNSPHDYASAIIPSAIPSEFDPSVPIEFPHILGFSKTLIRLRRFFNRRKLADDIGREVAALCLGAHREWRQTSSGSEQESVLDWEESHWPKSVRQDDEKVEQGVAKEKIWVPPMVLDERISTRMRRFRLLPEDEARAAAIVVPEEDVEGWIKGQLRQLCRWGVKTWQGKKGPELGDLSEATD